MRQIKYHDENAKHEIQIFVRNKDGKIAVSCVCFPQGKYLYRSSTIKAEGAIKLWRKHEKAANKRDQSGNLRSDPEAGGSL